MLTMERHPNDSAYGSIDHSQKSASYGKSQKSSGSSSYEDTKPSANGTSSCTVRAGTDPTGKQANLDGRSLDISSRPRCWPSKVENGNRTSGARRRKKCIEDFRDPLLDSETGNINLSQNEKTFSAIISMQGLIVHTSGTSLLGYPKDLWIGRNFTDFVYPDDRTKFSSHLTKNYSKYYSEDFSLVLIEERYPKSLFCRLRKYIDGNDDADIGEENVSYQTFHIETQKTDPINISTDIFSKDATASIESPAIYVSITATQLDSAYRVPEEIPTMHQFTTCHSASCFFCHVDSSAIPYLGFLPQDILGSNVFDYYHPEDLPHLQEVYQQILKEEGRLFRSKPYRFQVRNGHYVLLETEWSCFVNPWSRKLEFVIGMHRVLRGPKEPDVFSDIEPEVHIIAEEVLKESINIQAEIKQALTEPVKRNLKDLNEANKKHRERLAGQIRNLIEEMVQTMESDGYGQVCKESDSFSNQDSVVMGHISPHHQASDSDPSSETPLSYHHCNYNDNMQRYFDSRPKTYSTDESMESTGKEGTVALTRGDSPHRDDAGPESTMNCISPDSDGHVAPPLETYLGAPYVGVTLTKHTLQQHNKFTEKCFIQQNRETRGTNNHHARVSKDLVERLSAAIAGDSGAPPVGPNARKHSATVAATAPISSPLPLDTQKPKTVQQGVKRYGSPLQASESRKSRKHLLVDGIDKQTGNTENGSRQCPRGQTSNMIYAITSLEHNVRTNHSTNNLDDQSMRPNKFCSHTTSADAGPLFAGPPLITHVLMPAQYLRTISRILCPIPRLPQSVQVSVDNPITNGQIPTKRVGDQELKFKVLAEKEINDQRANDHMCYAKSMNFGDQHESGSDTMDSDIDCLTGSSLNSFLKSDISLKADSQNSSRSSSVKDDNSNWQGQVSVTPKQLFDYHMRSKDHATVISGDSVPFNKNRQLGPNS